jgi:hypothetical protein
LNLVERLGTPIDLHWHLLFSQALRNTFPIPIDEVIERSEEVTIRGRRARTMDATDSLMHLAVHAALVGGDRLIWLKDIEQSIRHRTPDWDAVVERSRSWRVHLPVALMLERAERTLDAAVPAGVINALAPQRPWRAITSAADRRFPAVQSRGGGNPARMLARTVKATPMASVTNLAAVLGRRVGRLITQRKWDIPETDDDPTNPESVQFPAGVDGDLERYLEEVQRNDR